jgi:hypothetical protein
VKVTFVLAVPAILLLALIMVVRSTLPLSTPPITIRSPSTTAAVVKQYGPIDEAEQVNVNVLIGGRSYSLLSIPNPSGVINGDGVTIGWNGEHRLTLGWPIGATPVSGPKSVDGIDVSYRAYNPDLSDVTAENTRKLPLHNASVTFRKSTRNGGMLATRRRAFPFRKSNALLRSVPVTVGSSTGWLRSLSGMALVRRLRGRWLSAELALNSL